MSDANLQPQILMARQPIFDVKQRVVAYELYTAVRQILSKQLFRWKRGYYRSAT